MAIDERRGIAGHAKHPWSVVSRKKTPQPAAVAAWERIYRRGAELSRCPPVQGTSPASRHARGRTTLVNFWLWRVTCSHMRFGCMDDAMMVVVQTFIYVHSPHTKRASPASRPLLGPSLRDGDYIYKVRDTRHETLAPPLEDTSVWRCSASRSPNNRNDPDLGSRQGLQRCRPTRERGGASARGVSMHLDFERHAIAALLTTYTPI